MKYVPSVSLLLFAVAWTAGTGVPSVAAAEAACRQQRGLMLERWAYSGGRIGSLQQILQTFEKAKRFLGRSFVPDIFMGHNPLGPQDKICHKYTGHLICPADGTHKFTTSSDDASFLLVNDRPVVAWPGAHGWRADEPQAEQEC